MKIDKNATRINDLEVGTELYDFYLNSDGHAEKRKVYVIKKNKTSFYFAYEPDDRINSYMRLKVAGTLPKIWRPNFCEIHYITDDKGFGEVWEKGIKQKRLYKDEIDSIKNELFFRNDLDELKDFYETISGFKRTKN